MTSTPTFIDAYPPGHIKGFPFSASPRFSTDMTAVKSGSENRNANWEQPLHKFTAPSAIRSQADYEAVKDMWMTLNGPLLTCALRDPLDQASRPMIAANVAPTVAATDQQMGLRSGPNSVLDVAVGDGSTYKFLLVKRYTFGDGEFLRAINLPVVASVLVALNGLNPATAHPTLPGGPYTWDVSRPGGEITFDHPLTGGVVPTAGFIFDCIVRFEADDSFDGIVQTYRLAGHADLTLIEQRKC